MKRAPPTKVSMSSRCSASTPEGAVTAVSKPSTLRITGLATAMYSSSASAATTTAWTIAL